MKTAGVYELLGQPSYVYMNLQYLDDPNSAMLYTHNMVMLYFLF